MCSGTGKNDSQWGEICRCACYEEHSEYGQQFSLKEDTQATWVFTDLNTESLIDHISIIK